MFFNRSPSRCVFDRDVRLGRRSLLLGTHEMGYLLMKHLGHLCRHQDDRRNPWQLSIGHGVPANAHQARCIVFSWGGVVGHDFRYYCTSERDAAWIYGAIATALCR